MTTNQVFSQFYGRKTARPLRGARSAALESGLPKFEIKLDADGQITSPSTGEVALRSLGEGAAGEGADSNLTPSPCPLPLGRGFIFPEKRAIWLEIGFGAGEHLLAQAAAHPDIGFIGCEPFINGISALLKGVEETSLTNVRVYTEDARFLLKALPDRAIARCFVLFADPWPKKRHNKRRIVNPATLDDLARVLTADGELFLATDDPDLAAWYEEIVAAHPAFAIRPASGDDAQTRPTDWPTTRYEEKALEKGLKPFYYVATSQGRQAL